MKIFAIHFNFLFFLLSMNFSIANDFSVDIAVSEQINKTEPLQKRMLQKSIQSGNTLINRFFDFSIYREDETWPKKVGRLLAINPRRFFEIVNQWDGELLVCPQVQLVELNQVGTEIKLIYKATGIGMLNRSGSQFNTPSPAVPNSNYFSPIKNGRQYSIELKIDANGKLLEVTSEQGVIPESYEVVVSGLKSPRLKKPIYIGESPSLVKSRISMDNQLVNDISHAASAICRSE